MEEKSYEQQVSEAKMRVREVGAAEAVGLRRTDADVVFLDVREHNEWNLFRIPGATHIPLADVRRRAAEVMERSCRVVVYCARGNRSALAADVMHDLGFADVVSLAGGIMAWVGAGGEVEE